MRENKRVQYIDIARGIAILCIILGHQGISEINHVVFTFHVPIFFLIAGYFSNNKLSLVDFIRNKSRSLLVPYLCTCILTIVFALILDFIQGGDVIYTLKEWILAALYGAGDTYYEPFYIKQIGALWFLWAMFWGSIFMRISLEMSTIIRPLFILGLFVLGYWTSHYMFWFPLSIQAGCCATLFIYIGYLAKKSENIYYQLPHEVKTISVIMSIILFLDFVFNFKSFWLVHCDIGRGVIDIAGSICACYLLLLLSQKIEKRCKRLTSILAYLGKYSLIVLCVHILELNVFPWGIIKGHFMSGLGVEELQARYILTFVKVLCIVCVAFVCSKIKFIKKMFGLEKTKKKELV